MESNRFCRISVTLVLITLVLLGIFSFNILRATAFCARTANPTQKNISKSKDKDAKFVTTKGKFKKDEDAKEIFITIPFDDKIGMPVAAIMTDTTHDADVVTWRFFQGQPQKYRAVTVPRFAVWTSGKIIWKTDEGKYFQSQVSTDVVKKMLSLIEAKNYNTPDNVKYSYSGSSLEEQTYSVLFVSESLQKNTIFCSPFHAWKESGLYYLYWDESDTVPLFYSTKKYTLAEFQSKVPGKFLAYLNTWDSLHSTLLSLILTTSPAKEIDIMKTKQISYTYRFNNKKSQWIRKEPVSKNQIKGSDTFSE